MNSNYRLSEMAGIRDPAHEHSGSVWSLNAVLALLGAAILGVVFYFLDSRDPRYLFNPWTYAVITPVALALISTLLRTLVSQLVEKSMQIAFLLSLLIHVLLLVYAVNIVIFSRMWPDVMESLAVQREALKRESLQARQYLQFSGSSSATKRPDYLKFIPTEAEPTDVEVEQRDEALQVKPTEQALLPSPDARLQRTARPHMIERQQEAQSSPSIDQSSAPLSRSELRSELAGSSFESARKPLRYRSNDAPVTEALQPASLSEARKSYREQSGVPELSRLERPAARSAASSTSIERAEMEPIVQQVRPDDLNLARSSSQLRSKPEKSSVQAIDSPNLASGLAPLKPVDSIATRKGSKSSSSLSSLSEIEGPTPDAKRSLSTAVAPRRSAPAASSLATKGASEARLDLPREVAGGRVSPPAPTSAPILGTRDFGSTASPAANEAVSSLDAPRRRQGDRRTGSPQLDPGLLAAPAWNGELSNTTGSSGRSPLDLANLTEATAALANDVASLEGNSSGAIDRSALGAGGLSDAVAATPPGVSRVEGVASNSAASEGRDEAVSSLVEASVGLTRASRSEGVAGLSEEVFGELNEEALTGLQPSAGRPNVSRVQGGSERLQADLQETLRNDFGRSELATGARGVPELSGVEVLADASLEAGSSSGSVQVAEQIGPIQRSSSGARGGLDLPLDAAMGPGGLADVLSDSVVMLPRRRQLDPVLLPPQIDPQRFSRQEIGGPLAAGSPVNVPTPAFKQRIDRLRESESQMKMSSEPQTELAIERGLLFLSKNQRPDGAWRLQDFDTQVLMRSDTAATGLSLLAFQGAGYTHREYKYADNVDRALRFLIERQLANGDLYIRQDPASDQNAWLYSHAIATLALCEAYGMTQDPELRNPAQRALDFMVASQDSQRGGWRYRPGFGSDTSVTGWFMMAFKSGQLADLDVPPETFERIKTFLDRSQSPDGDSEHLYRYNPYALDTIKQRHGLQPTAVMTSVGLLMRLYFGWSRDKDSMQDGAAYLLDHPPRNGTRETSLRDTYYWYYATQVIFHMGGDYWEQWHDRLYPILIDSQVVTGANAGSWDPLNPTPDLWARYGGRLYVTTMNLLSLEVSYRHLPLYDATAE